MLYAEGDAPDHFFSIRVADTPLLRERALAFAHRIYRLNNLRPSESPAPRPVRPPFAFFVENPSGEIVGIVSLVFDETEGLPCDQIFRDHMRRLRGSGRKIVEITRLAVDSSFRAHRTVLLRRSWLLATSHESPEIKRLRRDGVPNGGFADPFSRWEQIEMQGHSNRVGGLNPALIRWTAMNVGI